MKAYTEEQLALHAHIVAQNAAFVEQCKANGSTFYMHPVEDLDHWIEYGINNIAQYEHMQAVSLFTDMYKDIVGIKPRWNFEEMTLEQINHEIDLLSKQQQQNEKWEAEQKAIEKSYMAERKKANAYKPNLAFSGLRDLLAAK
jgi:hypothetical protein